MQKRWGRTEYIDIDTGEIKWSREIKELIYKVVKEHTRIDRGYTVTEKHIKIIAKQQNLWRTEQKKEI